MKWPSKEAECNSHTREDLSILMHILWGLLSSWPHVLLAAPWPLVPHSPAATLSNVHGRGKKNKCIWNFSYFIHFSSLKLFCWGISWPYLIVFVGYQISSLCLHGGKDGWLLCTEPPPPAHYEPSPDTPSHLGLVPNQSTPTHSLQTSLDCVDLCHIPLRDWFFPHASASWQPHWPPLLPISCPWVFPC